MTHPDTDPRFRIAILLSGAHGRGSNMAALAASCADGATPAQVVGVVGTVAAAPAMARAASLGLSAVVIGARGDDYEHRLLAHLAGLRPDLLCLAGYMRKLPGSVIAAYRDRIVNVHPALLPSFGGQGMYGMHVHAAVLERGCKVSGCTVHFVDEEFDAGPIILQRCVPVEEGDTPETLGRRVLDAEHAAYPEAVRWVAEGRARVEGRRVRVG